MQFSGGVGVESDVGQINDKGPEPTVPVWVAYRAGRDGKLMGAEW